MTRLFFKDVVRAGNLQTWAKRMKDGFAKLHIGSDEVLKMTVEVVSPEEKID